MKKTGLVLEGGALRGLFSAGVFDVMLENDIQVDGIIGVSAGASFGCNYKSKQPGRVLRYNQRFAHDWRYCSLKSLLLTGDLYGAKFCYHEMPDKLDIFDGKTYDENPVKFYAVVTDMNTGRPVYKLIEHHQDCNEWIRASSSMPLVSRIVNIDGGKYLDGGIADSIPLQYFQSIGYNHNIVITTQPAEYRKAPNPFMPLIRMKYRKYPAFIKAVADRHVMYNAELDYLADEEKTKNTLVIRPPHKLPINHISHDPEEMRTVYNIGRTIGDKYLSKIRSLIK